MSTINGSCSESHASQLTLKGLQEQLQQRQIEQQKTAQQQSAPALKTDTGSTGNPPSQQGSNNPTPGAAAGSIINTFA